MQGSLAMCEATLGRYPLTQQVPITITLLLLLLLQIGLDEGATLLTGGRRPPSCPRGYFLEPTVFVNVAPHMRLWKEEIFGPVLSGEC
jgi:hypothetical protein